MSVWRIRKVLALGFCATFLASCAPSAASVGTAIALTQIAMPTATTPPTATLQPTSTALPTPTDVPLADIDLVPMLVQPGDLPAGVTTGQVIKNGESFVLSGVPAAEQKVFLEFGAQGKSAGGIYVWLFANEENAKLAYAKVSESVSAKFGTPVLGTWTVAIAEPPDIFDYNFLVSQGLAKSGTPVLGALAFQECRAIAFIRMAYERQYLDPIVSYANNVAKRLKPIVCK